MSAPLSRASSGLEFATIAPDRSCSTELPAARSEFAYPLISTNRVDEFRDHPLGDLAASANRRPSLKRTSAAFTRSQGGSSLRHSSACRIRTVIRLSTLAEVRLSALRSRAVIRIDVATRLSVRTRAVCRLFPLTPW